MTTAIENSRTVTLTLNGREVKAREGQSVLEAARNAGIFVPTLCYHPKLKPNGSCGLCLVGFEGTPDLYQACCWSPTGWCADRIVNIREGRRPPWAILAEHPHACPPAGAGSGAGVDVCLRNVE